MKIMRAISISRMVLLAGGVLAVIPGARADDCTLASTAAIAQAKVPHAVTQVMTAPGKPTISVEMIFMDDKAYTQMNGTWHAMPFSAQQQIDFLNAASKRAEQTTRSCQKLASEPINGEAATVLMTHSETNGATSETRVWISDKTGLPLKSELRLSTGMAVTDDFRYDNIEVPPGVK